MMCSDWTATTWPLTWQEEAMELAQLRTQLLQVKMEHLGAQVPEPRKSMEKSWRNMMKRDENRD